MPEDHPCLCSGIRGPDGVAEWTINPRCPVHGSPTISCTCTFVRCAGVDGEIVERVLSPTCAMHGRAGRPIYFKDVVENPKVLHNGWPKPELPARTCWERILDDPLSTPRGGEGS